jgi:pyruvate/2-oxoglutarate/acetoin dehydrogenase E1 component/TPP-dependent pyruvate/acetoin dehydrogenase alpha subunit
VTETVSVPPLVGDRVRMFELMVLIRTCDERIRRGLSGGEFACTYWPATGQEAIAAALGSVLRLEDQLVTTYRGLHDQIAKGVPLGALVAEILTRESGVNAGKGGAMHISYPTAGLVLSTGIVGSGLPIATGVGMALQLKGSEHVVVASFGDGATGTGSFHEAVNLAALWRLPVVLLCQNNRYAEMTPTADAQPVATVAERASAYGIGATTVDGNDPDAVHGALSAAVERARSGGGPTLVECTTFRLFGHYFGDPMRYIPPEELEAARKAEPVARYRSTLLAEGVLTEEIAEEVERQARDEVEAAFTEALAADLPSGLAAKVDVYGDVGAGGVDDSGPRNEAGADGGTTTISMREALNRALDRALAADPAVVLLGEDIADPGGGISQVTKGLSTTHGAERVRDTPISEAAIVGAAVGAAASGLRPVAEVMIMDFISIALDQLINHAAKSRFMSGGRVAMPLTVRTAVFGGIGSGATHSQTLESWLAHVPGLKVVVPSTPADAMGLLTSCIFDDDPCVVVENVALYGTSGPVPEGHHRVPIGTATVARSGSDVTIVTYGRTVRDALAAAEELAGEGVDAEVVDLRTLVPLDAETVLGSVGRTRRCVVAHHATRFAGFGAEVAGLVHEELFGELEAPVQRVGAAFAPIGSAATLEAAVMPSATSIADAVRATLGG